MAKFAVIIPAAGAGKRFKEKSRNKQNKIFQRIKDQPVFISTIEKFSTRDDVVQIQLVVSAEDMEELKTRFGGHLGFMGASIVQGGATRAESVRNALAKVSDDADYVCIHDAVRPCISPLWIDDVFAEAEKTGAAILAYPLHGTMKKVADSGTIDETICRKNLWEAQTPQVFRKDILQKAYAADIDGLTDDAQVVEKSGQPVSVVLGDPRNIKITTPADLSLASAVIGTLPKPKPKKDGNPFGEAQW